MNSFELTSAVAEIQWLRECVKVAELQITRVEDAIEEVTDDNELGMILEELNKITI